MPRKKVSKPSWPADSVEKRPIEALTAYARNSRQHSPEQVAQIASSIEEWGWTIPVLIDEDGQIIAGHGRVLAAEALGIAEIPVMIARGWSDAKKAAYVIADNKLAENATWDEELLKLEVGDLLAEGFDVSLTGLDLDELAASPASEVDATKEWEGMPEFDQVDKSAFRTIPVHFKDQAAVDAFAKMIDQTISEKTRYIWYPTIEIERMMDKRYGQ